MALQYVLGNCKLDFSKEPGRMAGFEDTGYLKIKHPDVTEYLLTFLNTLCFI